MADIVNLGDKLKALREARARLDLTAKMNRSWSRRWKRSPPFAMNDVVERILNAYQATRIFLSRNRCHLIRLKALHTRCVRVTLCLCRKRPRHSKKLSW
jgi:hypothetical protein